MTILSVRVPNFKPGEPNINGSIIEKENYLSRLRAAIDSHFGLPVYTTFQPGKGDINKIAAMVKDFSFSEDAPDETKLILDITIIDNEYGLELVDKLEKENQGLYACMMGMQDSSKHMHISDFLYFYHSMN